MAANIAASRHESSFLALSPPHWAARGLSYAITAIVIGAAIAAVVIKLPETVTANFVLVPARGADPIKATRQGIVNRIFVSEGQSVNRGDLIATLSSESAGDRAADLLTTETQMAGAGESFINARTKFTAQIHSDEQEMRTLAARVEHLEGLINLKRQQLTLLKGVTDSYQKLFGEGIVSRAQLTEKQLEIADFTAELQKLVAQQYETRSAIEKLRIDSSARQTEFKELERTYREKTATDEIRVASLKAGLAGSDGNEIRLTAPCAGTILRLHVKSSGAVLQEGAVVAELACAGETLQAELSLPESGIGKLKPGQGVKLKYDAFPYQRYGVKYGSVVWLSPAAVETSEGRSFKSHVEIAEKEITSYGQSRPLLAGMSGKAEIVVGTRSLIEYVIEPLRQLKENAADAPEHISKR